MLSTVILGLLIIVIAVTFAMTELREMARVTLFGSRNNNGHDFAPSRDILPLHGKVVLITGAAGDLGRNTAIELARHGRPARIYVADLPRGEDAKLKLVQQITREAYGDSSADTEVKGQQTEIRFLDLDLSSMDAVRKCAADFASQDDRLDILYLNAGIIRVAAGVTTEGYESHFGVNYLGHALLTRLLIPTLLQTAERQPDVRIIVISSEGHVVAPKEGIDFSKLRSNGADIVGYSVITKENIMC
jgi:retinol dehydrogenase 12